MSPLRITADVEVLDNATLVALAGVGNEHLKIVARTLSIDCGVRGNTIRLAGDADAVAVAERFLAEAAELLRGGTALEAADFARGLAALRDDPIAQPARPVRRRVLDHGAAPPDPRQGPRAEALRRRRSAPTT